LKPEPQARSGARDVRVVVGPYQPNTEIRRKRPLWRVVAAANLAKLQQHYTCRDHDRDAADEPLVPPALAQNRTYAKIIDSLWWGQSCDFELQLSPA
jgi:hypothetical protein